MNVREHMTSAPVTISPRDLLSTAAAAMRSGGFRRLPVVENGELIGMLTDRDVREHVGHLADTRVTAAMTESPVTVTPDAPIAKAARIMIDRKIGGLPVVDGGRLVGIVTTTDLLRGFLVLNLVWEAEMPRAESA